MKTIKEWLSELPEPARSQALDNYEGPENRMASSILEALMIAFIWEATVEGWDYWNNIYEELEKL